MKMQLTKAEIDSIVKAHYGISSDVDFTLTITDTISNTITKAKTPNERYKLALTPYLSAACINELINDEYSFVRRAIATRPDLTTKQIDILINDDIVEVRQAIVTNQTHKLNKRQINVLLKDFDLSCFSKHV